jgi:hypothetical protein
VNLRHLFLLLSLFCLPGIALAQVKPSAPPAKKMPARDPKTGKFVKGGGKMGEAKAKPAKKTPPRDPKTGRFMKAGGAGATMAGEGKAKPAKKTPARDPKTGKFIKSPEKK